MHPPLADAYLPFAFACMGWGPGLVALLMGIVVTYYASILLASLHEFNGVRYVRYRDLATAICGNPWAGYAVVTFQQVGRPLGGGCALRAPALISASCFGSHAFSELHAAPLSPPP